LTPQQAEHREFLDRYYSAARPVYDLTRKYYLFGRDRALAGLLAGPWDSLVEVGPGTGRNLHILHRQRPNARLGGVEAAAPMLAHAARRCPWATFRRGFAEDAIYTDVLGEPPQRILFSYCMSMVQRPDAAIERALAGLAPGGELHIVDFADLSGLPAPVRAGLRRWLAAFRVAPLDPGWLASWGAEMTFGPGRYYVLARLRARM
jgi:S-adenosylmethionine-diacylgycerolhomoserine-N-methlytransferase